MVPHAKTAGGGPRSREVYIEVVGNEGPSDPACEGN